MTKTRSNVRATKDVPQSMRELAVRRTEPLVMYGIRLRYSVQDIAESAYIQAFHDLVQALEAKKMFRVEREVPELEWM